MSLKITLQGSLKITLQRVKYFAAMSKETNCFVADVHLDGAKAGTASNEGHGGPTLVEPRALADKLNAHGATLPKATSTLKDAGDPSGFFTYDQTGETLVDDLLVEHLVERDVKKLLSRRVLYTRAGKPGVYQTKAVKPDALAGWLADPALTAKLQAAEVLNLLPLAAAVAVYKTCATC